MYIYKCLWCVYLWYEYVCFWMIKSVFHVCGGHLCLVAISGLVLLPVLMSLLQVGTDVIKKWRGDHWVFTNPLNSCSTVILVPADKVEQTAVLGTVIKTTAWQHAPCTPGPGVCTCPPPLSSRGAGECEAPCPTLGKPKCCWTLEMEPSLINKLEKKPPILSWITTHCLLSFDFFSCLRLISGLDFMLFESRNCV